LFFTYDDAEGPGLLCPRSFIHTEDTLPTTAQMRGYATKPSCPKTMMTAFREANLWGYMVWWKSFSGHTKATGELKTQKTALKALQASIVATRKRTEKKEKEDDKAKREEEKALKKTKREEEKEEKAKKEKKKVKKVKKAKKAKKKENRKKKGPL
jgi:hypothetical protein